MTLVAKNLSVRVKRRTLVRSLTCRVRRGRVTVVLGPNGSGKSTLLRHLAGLTRAGTGTVEIDGLALAELSPIRRAASVSWQGALPSAEFGFTVRERLGMSGGTRSVEAAIAKLDLGHRADASLDELSTGEQQRVEIAALWRSPAPVWLLDEPTAHLDLRHQSSVLSMLRREAAGGRAVCVVLHDLAQAQAIADDCIALDGSERPLVGTAEQILCSRQLEQIFATPICAAQDLTSDPLLPDFASEAALIKE